jgi:DnaJ like chaperone protein
MSIWSRIAEILSALAKGEGLSSIFARLRTPPEQTVGFAIAVIALGAKMAKADGHVTRDEVAVFRRIFHIPKKDEANAAKVFNLARQDVAGYDVYAKQIARMFDGKQQELLVDLVEGLFHVAVADGEYHPQENDFVHRVSAHFGIDERTFTSLRARFVPNAEPDPYDVLGIDPNTELDEIKKRWRALVRETHPDAMIARGLPEEAIKLATSRLADINHAWEVISHRND